MADTRMLPLAASVLRGTLEKFLDAKATETVAAPWESLTFKGWRVVMTFDRDVVIPDGAEFATPGFIVADISSSGSKVEALLVSA
jgi:hypothetical protein